MPTLLNTLVITVMVLNLVALGTANLSQGIRWVARQGVLLGLPPLLMRPGLGTLALAVGVVAVKGWTVPRLLQRAMRESETRHEAAPLLKLMPTVLLGALAAGLALAFSGRLPMRQGESGWLLLPASLATVSAGFLMMVTRATAVGQALGYLILENGIFIFGLLLVEAMPLVVEMGVLLDLFVAVFVVSIIIHHIQRAFSTLDTRGLSLLKD